jgi:hypothetical protein
METTLWLGASAAKLSTVPTIALGILVIGAVLAVVGWGWLVFQNARFGLVHGLLSLLIPPYALLYAFWGMEHRHKSAFAAAFLGGLVVGGLGYLLVYASDACENDLDCGIRRNLLQEVTPAGGGGASDDAGGGSGVQPGPAGPV